MPRSKHTPTPRNSNGDNSGLVERKLAELHQRLAQVDRLIATLEDSIQYSQETKVEKRKND